MPESTKSAKNKFCISCYYIFILVTIMIAMYMIFSNVKELRVQGIYWFGIAAVFIALPVIGEIIDVLNIKGIEVKFRDKIEDMERIQLIFKEKLKEEKDKIENIKNKQMTFDEKLKEKKDKIKDIERKQKTFDKKLEEVNLLPRLQEYLYNEEPNINVEDLKKDIIQAEQTTLISIHAVLSEFREKTVYHVLEAENNNVSNSRRARFEKLIPIREALIEAKSKDTDKMHIYHAELAYVLKDQPDRQWKKAYHHINKAIESRDKLDLGDLCFTIYEFNRLICGLHVSEMCSPEQLEKDFETAYNDLSIRWMLFETDEVLAPGLLKWITENKPNEQKNWKDIKKKKGKTASKPPHERGQTSDMA